MIVLESPSVYFSPFEMEANSDTPQLPEKEAWQLSLSNLKAAILEGNILKARLLMYALECHILEAKMSEYRRGFEHGSELLPF